MEFETDTMFVFFVVQSWSWHDVRPNTDSSADGADPESADKTKHKSTGCH